MEEHIPYPRRRGREREASILYASYETHNILAQVSNSIRIEPFAPCLRDGSGQAAVTARLNHLDRVELSCELCRNNYDCVSTESLRYEGTRVPARIRTPFYFSPVKIFQAYCTASATTPSAGSGSRRVGARARNRSPVGVFTWVGVPPVLPQDIVVKKYSKISNVLINLCKYEFDINLDVGLTEPYRLFQATPKLAVKAPRKCVKCFRRLRQNITKRRGSERKMHERRHTDSLAGRFGGTSLTRGQSLLECWNLVKSNQEPLIDKSSTTAPVQRRIVPERKSVLNSLNVWRIVNGMGRYRSAARVRQTEIFT
ncbi:hypothetical protein EVAR_22178_1 [Eumeta japonica]|uniref:Uncharacterized protein n=1 Tax=Eumeta variegata TaxID=151549 RepID=A0A4C1XUX0_EUMVA|nr:hypothetical protein EVAR_22178_1 [Eumeta japonica]